MVAKSVDVCDPLLLPSVRDSHRNRNGRGRKLLHIVTYIEMNGDLYGLFDRWDQAKWFISYWGIGLFVGHVASDLRFRYSILADEFEENKQHLAKVEESYKDLHVVKKLWNRK